MVEHEAKCFLNPGRKCGLCEERHGAETYGRLVKELVTMSVESDSYITEPKTYEATADGVKWLCGEVDDCPACMLAVLQQARVMAFDHFNYIEKRDAWWREEAACDYG
jgi:hypothetical protein